MNVELYSFIVSLDIKTIKDWRITFGYLLRESRGPGSDTTDT